jgi:putative membrane protein insertion efficiency factor
VTTWSQRRILASIEAYQRGFAWRPSPCRFYPTCSNYAHEAVELHGTARGGWLTVRRLLRCRPFGPSGFDPVPGSDPTNAAAPTEVREDA